LLAFMFLLEGVEPTQPCIPIGFQGIGDQAIVRIDLEVAPPRQLGLVASALQLHAPHAARFLDPTGDLVLYRERHLDRGRYHGSQQYFADRLVYGSTAHRLTQLASATYHSLGALIVGFETVLDVLVAHAHARTAQAAEHAALQQADTFA